MCYLSRKMVKVNHHFYLCLGGDIQANSQNNRGAEQTNTESCMPYHLLEHFLLSRIHAKHSIEVKSLGSFLGCTTVCYIHFSFDGLLQHGWDRGRRRLTVSRHIQSNDRIQAQKQNAISISVGKGMISASDMDITHNNTTLTVCTQGGKPSAFSCILAGRHLTATCTLVPMASAGSDFDILSRNVDS